MPPRKPKRPKLDGEATQEVTQATTPTSLENFALLPHELKALVIRLACSLPATTTSSSSAKTATCGRLSPKIIASPPANNTSSALPGLDTSTALSLVRVSRSLYALVIPIIFANIWITRPSQLASLQRALAARPQLGRLVASLHVGPDDPLPDWYYPISERESYYDSDCSNRSAAFHPDSTWMTSTLRGPRDESLRPRASFIDQEYPVDDPRYDCSSEAVSEALFVVQRGLDVNLMQPSRSWDTGATLLGEEWLVRMFEAQAALDLYLMAMRRVEDKEEQEGSRKSQRRCHCEEESCPTFPPLLLQGTAKPTQHKRSAKAPPEEPLVLTRSQLLQHLARPGSITDRFDHPLLFARSGVDLVDRATDHGSARMDRQMTPDEDFEDSDLSDLYSRVQDSSDYDKRLPPRTLDVDMVDPALPSTATIGSILMLVRSIFTFTPLVANLSLTGVLDRAVCGSADVSLKKLRHLSLGPPPPAWFSPLNFDNVKSLHSLRVCGIELCSDEAISIAHGIRKLRHFRWSMAAKWDESQDDERLFASTLPEILETLRDDKVPSPSPESSDSEFPRLPKPVDWKKLRRRIEGRDEEEEEDDADFDETTLPLYELKLHPTDVKNLLDAAPSQEARDAWQSGHALHRDSHCRLLLVESKAAAKGRWKGVACTSVEELYREGREWWERCAGLRGGA